MQIVKYMNMEYKQIVKYMNMEYKQMVKYMNMEYISEKECKQQMHLNSLFIPELAHPL